MGVNFEGHCLWPGYRLVCKIGEGLRVIMCRSADHTLLTLYQPKKQLKETEKPVHVHSLVPRLYCPAFFLQFLLPVKKSWAIDEPRNMATCTKYY